MKADYSADVRTLYEKYAGHATLLNEHYAIQAGTVIERCFPPANADDVFCILTALNLLNACVKQTWGKQIVTYNYIKGMAACLLLRQLVLPIDGVATYMDRKQRVTYFETKGVQISFHYLPLYRELQERMPEACRGKMEWVGIYLQKTAVEVFRLACPDDLVVSDDEESTVRWRMLNYRKLPMIRIFGKDMSLNDEAPTQSDSTPSPDIRALFSEAELKKKRPRINRRHPVPFVEDKVASLQAAIGFNIWQSNLFMLWRRKDNKYMPVIRYNGRNYREVLDFLLADDHRIYRRPEGTLEVGKLYHITPQLRLRTIAPSRYVRSVTQNSYLFTGRSYRNLCLTYGIARYLAVMYPKLRFVCTLNYNRLCVHRRYYTLADLYGVPLRSVSRDLKVWVPVDRHTQLGRFDLASLPDSLIADYMEAEDYYQEFEVITGPDGMKGLYAYRRHHLLPCIYSKIKLRNYHAYVQGHNKKWAIYALNDERFVSDFIYDHTWYDAERGAIVGMAFGTCQVIFKFNFGKK